VSRSYTYEQLAAGNIKSVSVSVGSARIITTPPREFLAAMSEIGQRGPYPEKRGRGRPRKAVAGSDTGPAAPRAAAARE
jgi:hypothetical protein